MLYWTLYLVNVHTHTFIIQITLVSRQCHTMVNPLVPNVAKWQRNLRLQMLPFGNICVHVHFMASSKRTNPITQITN